MAQQSGKPRRRVAAANAFAYNDRSEVTNAVMDADTYSYAYDPIGNRTGASANGDLTAYAKNKGTGI